MSLKALQMCSYLNWQANSWREANSTVGAPKIKTFLTLYTFDASYIALAAAKRFSDHFLKLNSSLLTVHQHSVNNLSEAHV